MPSGGSSCSKSTLFHISSIFSSWKALPKPISYNIVRTDCFCRKWWGWWQSRIWITRSAWAIYSKVALKHSTISTGKLVMKPIVSRRLTREPEGRTTLNIGMGTIWMWCGGSEREGPCFLPLPSSSGRSSRQICQRWCTPPRQPPVKYCPFALFSPYLSSSTWTPPQFVFWFMPPCPSTFSFLSPVATTPTLPWFWQLCVVLRWWPPWRFRCGPVSQE